jgi:hypothetical protein
VAVAVDPESESKIRQLQCWPAVQMEKPGINPVSVIKWIMYLIRLLGEGLNYFPRRQSD